jgi:hypothetical protein
MNANEPARTTPRPQAPDPRVSDAFRHVNDRIVELGSPVDDLMLICECYRLDCTRTLHMTHAEYSSLREQDGLHALVPGHEDRTNEEIVRRSDGYVVVGPARAYVTGRIAA